MSRTITTTVYKYAELSDKAKDKARDWFRNGFYDDSFWSDCVIDDAKACLEHLGWDVDRIYFSGFSSQGDGACFEGQFDSSRVSLKGLRAHAPKDAELRRICRGLAKLARSNKRRGFTATVKHSGHYYHDGCVNFMFNFPEPESWAGRHQSIAAQFDKWEVRCNDDMGKLIELSRDAMKWSYRQLEKEWEYQNSDEAVTEAIEANDYEFTAEGERA